MQGDDGDPGQQVGRGEPGEQGHAGPRRHERLEQHEVVAVVADDRVEAGGPACVLEQPDARPPVAPLHPGLVPAVDQAHPRPRRQAVAGRHGEQQRVVEQDA